MDKQRTKKNKMAYLLLPFVLSTFVHCVHDDDDDDDWEHTEGGGQVQNLIIDEPKLDHLDEKMTPLNYKDNLNQG